MILPSELERLILNVVGLPYFDRRTQVVGKKRINGIRKQLVKLSADFAHCKPTPEKYCDAYFLYYFPMNVLKVMIIINELQNLYPLLFRKKSEFKILDIGCGEGAGLLGIYYGLHHATRLSLTGIDASSHMVQRCRGILNSLFKKDPRCKVKVRRQNVSLGFFKKKSARYDVVLFANSLAEICRADTIPVGFIEHVMEYLTTNGIIIIIEPALKHLSRRLMKLRDEILFHKRGSVLLPCLHTSPCPLFNVRGQKEWCHEIRTWQPPEFMNVINKKLHREMDRLKFSYLVMSKQTVHKKLCNGFLVVSHLLKEKGKQKCFLCTPHARVELIRLNKSTGKQNTEFSSIKKGDIILVDNVIRKRPNYWQVCQHTRVKIIYRVTSSQ